MQTLNRHRERARDQRADLDEVLDLVPVATLSTVVDGRPWVVPMLIARDGDRILLHGSTGAGALRHVAEGAEAVLCVHSLDGIVVGTTTFSSSANYRSAVVRGRVTSLQGEDQHRALEVFSERLIPGRTGEVVPMTTREEAATMAGALPIEDGQWIVKARTGPPSAPERDPDAWGGVVPVRTVTGAPEPAPWVAPGTPVPDSVRGLAADRPLEVSGPPAGR